MVSRSLLAPLRSGPRETAPGDFPPVASRQAGADENIYRTWDRIAMKFGLIDQLKIKAS